MPITKEREDLHKIVEEAGKEENINVHWTDAGGGSDGNIVASVGACVVDAIGPIGGLAHNEKEYLEIDSIEPSIRLFKNIIKNYLVYGGSIMDRARLRCRELEKKVMSAKDAAKFF